MGKNNPVAHPFTSGDRSPFKDVTNSFVNGNAKSSHTQKPKKRSSQSWYARMFDEKKEEFLEKRSVAQQQRRLQPWVVLIMRRQHGHMLLQQVRTHRTYDNYFGLTLYVSNCSFWCAPTCWQYIGSIFGKLHCGSLLSCFHYLFT